MPPSRHSSSSHSSRPSSHRASSRSSGSSYRTPSSHSSSSCSSSSSSRSSFFGGRPSFPSRHSSGSYASAPARRSPGPAHDPAGRPRINQPIGFAASTLLKPRYYYGRKHSYVYYPEAWTDAGSGTSYEKGYYDENGRRYDSVTFEESGKYRDVVCHCPYCEQDTILDLRADSAGGYSLKCPHCGGPMEIRSELDERLNGVLENTHVYNAEESLRNAFPKKKKKRTWLIVALVLFALSIYGNKLNEKEKEQPYIQQISVVENSGSTASQLNTVFLEKQADGSYHVVTDVLRADRILYYDRQADSYYDEASKCWLWKNTDVKPAVWQYWVEGISSDFGDYGWMEHNESGWFIEKSEGNWISLPDRYDTGGLWYIE